VQEGLTKHLTQQYRCDKLPPFDATGNLPPGIHEAAWDEFVARYGATPHRLTLLAGLKAALDALRAAQKAKYGGEFFPAESAADPFGTRFLEFLQHDKQTGDPKGIIAIDLGGLP
jgi:hypothetical protein